MPRNAQFLVVFAFVSIFAASAAAGQWDDCAQQADPDLSIRACSAILEAGREKAANRAGAYHNRGHAYYHKERGGGGGGGGGG